jgi:hypothetical protein
MYEEREQINQRQNNFLLQNWERLETQKNEILQPIKKTWKKTNMSVIETARQLYVSGKTHKEISLLLGVSISTAGRFVRLKDHDQRRKH